MSELIDRIRAVLGERARDGESLSRRSSLRIGGPAKVWAQVDTVEELSTVCEIARELGAPLAVIGLGSNTLFPDEGIEGVVVRLGGELAAWRVDGERAVVGAGAVNAHLVRALLGQGLVGAEFLTLIPGTFGGAVALNAGTKERELSQVLAWAEVLEVSASSASLVRYSGAQLEMSYRHAKLAPGAVVVRGEVTLEVGDADEARERVRADKERRDKTQPYRLASVGSTFANPPGDFAGRLVEAAGLKGHRVGGARVSELHANFFINEEHASARDFLSLMALARVRVRQRFGVELRPEVRFVGFDGWSAMVALEAELGEGER